MLMITRRALAAVAVGFAIAPRALAGGWATVRLDAPATSATLDVPLRVSFMVKQHDVTPLTGIEPEVIATQTESGDELRVTGAPGAQPGRYVADLTFPAVGPWKWRVEPAPFPGTGFAPILVHAAGDTAAPGSVATDPACDVASAITIDITDTAFSPARAEIVAGTVVIWRNNSAIPHTVMSESPAFADSGVIEPGQMARLTLTQPGTYAYWCGPHPTMTGTIEVAAAPA